MIDQDLINKCESDLNDFGSLSKCQGAELLKNYISLVEQNADLHKKLAKYRGVYEGSPYSETPPNNLAM